jgi:pilus assembly protein CpaF
MESRPVNIEGKGLITIRDLVRNSLRMRPDRIVVGEVRDGAALDMLQAMNTGHEGSLTTIHANSSKDALVRIENLVLMAGVEFPIRVIREQISEAIDIIIHQARLRDGSRRVTEICEVTGIDVDSIQLQDIFRFSNDSDDDLFGTLRRSGLPIVKRNKFVMRNVEIPKGY